MMEPARINKYFIADYLEFIKGDKSKIDNLLKYAFYIILNEDSDMFLNFAYGIIIKYAIEFDDYKPLLEFAIIFGYSPIIDLIINHRKINIDSEVTKFLSEFYIEDNRYGNKILTSGQKAIYNLIETNHDYSIVAPTSFGKTELMLESSLNAKQDAIIIVPLIALLNQVKTDLNKIARKRNFDVKIITHHEINPSSKYKNIYVLTQERCYELLKKNKLKKVSDLFVDEAHKLLLSDERSYKLAQIIFLLRKKHKPIIRYYSPVLNDPALIKIKGLYDSQIETINGIRDMKNYNYYFYHNNKKELYIPNVKTMTSSFSLEDKYYSSFFEYIICNSKNKNIIFSNSPKKLEELAINFSFEIKEEYSDTSTYGDLINFIGEDYNVIDTLRKGIIYIHGEMPDIVRCYLLNLYRKNDRIKYLVTNSCVLEGVNTPSDNLFIHDYKIGRKVMTPQDFINLSGRINRINNIIESGDISRIICDIHFDANTTAKRRMIRNRIINKAYGILEQEVENEFLESVINLNHTEEFENSLKQIKLLDDTINVEDIFPTADIEVENDDVIRKCLLNGLKLNYKQKHEIKDRLSNFNDIDTIEELLYAIVSIFKLNQDDDIALSRLGNEQAVNFYSMLMEWLISGKTIKEKANRMLSYYKNKSNAELIYVGKRGDIAAELINGKLSISDSCKSKVHSNNNGSPKILQKLWTRNNHDRKKLYNIFIVKLKIEEDFIAFKLMPFIETIQDIDNQLINKKLYNKIKYKTTNEFEIELVKEGLSIYLAKELNTPENRKFIKITNKGISVEKQILDNIDANDVLLEELKILI